MADGDEIISQSLGLEAGGSIGIPLYLAQTVSTTLYVLAFICWAPVVHLQIRIRDLAGEALSNGEALPHEAIRLYRTWFALGWPAFGALMVVFWLMVSRPMLW